MNSGKTIRVIKSAQRNARDEVAESRSANKPGMRHGDREMAGQVSEWIGEFRQRRREEARRSFASLFVEPIPVPYHSS